MAYDPTRPADIDLIKKSAELIRVNFEGLRKDGIVIAKPPLYAAGEPKSSLGENGDSYVDTATGNQYIKTTAGKWKMVLDLSKLYKSGSAVEQAIIFGDGTVPDNSVGNDNDLYINHSSSLVNGIGYRGLYRKIGGTWKNLIDLSVTTVSTIGMVAFFADPSLVPKRGWLPFTGAEVGRVPYAGLFDLLGTAFGEGDGKTTFNLPDGRGKFLRALDLNCGLDLGREFGSFQDCAIENITGTFGKTLLLSGGGASGVFSISDIEKTPYTNLGGADRWGNVSINVSNIVNTSTETRPINIAFPLYICYI